MSASILMRLYQASPPSLRSLMATAKGLQLLWFRYGRETDDLIQEALERESWSPEQWKNWRETILPEMLHHAATTVPYYREQWARRRSHGDRSNWEDIANWPLLSKASVQQNPRAFLSDKPKTRYLYHENTSGTTGTPMELWFSKQTQRRYYALHDCRLRTWNDLHRSDPWAILGGQQVVPATATRPPYWVYNRAMRQLYLSANHVSRATVADISRELARSGATHLITYPSSLTYLAALCLELGLEAPRLKAVFANAEPLFDWQKDIVQRWLGIRPLETYGMGEKLAAASECSAGTLHLWPELGLLEIVEDESASAVPVGSVGRLAATGFLSREMPFVRYLVGDHVALKPEGEPCPCGRALPALDHIEGRSADMLIAPDGRRIFWINPIFYGLPVVESQVIQEDANTIRVLVVPASGFDADTPAEIAARLRQRMGDMDVIVEKTDIIPRGPNGKFRPVINKLPAE